MYKPSMALEPDAMAKARYLDAAVAEDYDVRRWSGLRGAVKHRTDSSAVVRALASLPADAVIFDVPCGTGRFTAAPGHRPVLAGDYSPDMIRVARGRGLKPRLGWLRCDIQRLPLADGAVGATLTVRFFHLIAPERRVPILRELGRVARHAVVVQYYHPYTLRQIGRMVRGTAGRPYELSRNALHAELEAAGLSLERTVEKWYVPFLSPTHFLVLRPPPHPTRPVSARREESAMALSAELKEILACPKCKGDLEFHEEKNEIWCKNCKLVYDIKDDIPVMLVEEARPLA